jgi:hypothetical protein
MPKIQQSGAAGGERSFGFGYYDSAVDMAQMGEGAYIQICATCLEYKPPPPDGFAYYLFSAYITIKPTLLFC